MITTEKNGRFTVLRFTHACGHAGESHCQSIHVGSFRKLAEESTREPCQKCTITTLRERVERAEAAAGQARAEERHRIAGLIADVGEALEGEVGPVVTALAVLVEAVR